MAEYLTLPGGPIHWEDHGGSGPLMVLVHGLGGSLLNWEVVGPRLTNRGRVVAIDLPGFGLSPPRDDWSLETHAQAIVETIEQLGGEAILIGNSMGALLCQMVAAQRPDLVSGLLLVSPAAPPRLFDPHVHWPTARRLAIQALPFLGPAMTRRMLKRLSPRELVHEGLRRITHKPGRVPMHVIEQLIALAGKRQHLPWARDAVPLTGQALRRRFTTGRSSYVAMVRRIKAPTLVVQGVADRIVSPGSVQWMCELRPDWSLIQLEDTGHTPQLDAPVRFLAVVEPWLDQLSKHEMSV